jgi:hypothetical protein
LAQVLLKALNADSRPVGGKKHRSFSFLRGVGLRRFRQSSIRRFEIAFSR